MNTSNRPLRVTNLLCTACLGSAMLVGVPALAQSQSAVGQTDSQKTGVEPRGTKVGPSTNPAEASPGMPSRSEHSSRTRNRENSRGMTSGPAAGGHVVSGAAIQKGGGTGRVPSANTAAPNTGSLSSGGVGVESHPGTEGGASPKDQR